MNNNLMFSSNKDDWETPTDLFEKLNEEFNFSLDPCSSHENKKCELHYTIEEDGLKQDWQGHAVFCNPPYGRKKKQQNGYRNVMKNHRNQIQQLLC